MAASDWNCHFNTKMQYTHPDTQMTNTHILFVIPPGMSTSSLYRLIWKTIKAINNCCHNDLTVKFPTSVDDVKTAAAGFSSISKEGCIWNCIAVVDGYHLQTITPEVTEVRNIRSFYSGHYKTHGLNIQGACDHHCRFVFLGVAGPGIMGDRNAIQQVDLHNLINGLPGLYCVIGDCAYTPSEKNGSYLQRC
jgi:hypothetical protein